MKSYFSSYKKLELTQSTFKIGAVGEITFGIFVLFGTSRWNNQNEIQDIYYDQFKFNKVNIEFLIRVKPTIIIEFNKF